MKNVMKKLFCLVVALLLVVALPLTAVAEQPPNPGSIYINDIGLLDRGQEYQLGNQLLEISERLNLTVAVYVSGTLDGYEIDYFTKTQYHQNYSAQDGVLLLVAMEEREWYIYTTGDAYDYLTDAALDDIEDAIVPLLSTSDYYDAFVTYANLCDKFLTMGQEGTPYRGAFPLMQNLLIALIVGLGVGLIVVTYMKSQLKSVRPRREAHEYTRPGGMNVTRSRDLFLYRTVSRRPKPKDSGSSGRSGGSRSGGRGGSF